jgi:hypothetical protein
MENCLDDITITLACSVFSTAHITICFSTFFNCLLLRISYYLRSMKTGFLFFLFIAISTGLNAGPGT